jgi:hypothetical protein
MDSACVVRSQSIIKGGVRVICCMLAFVGLGYSNPSAAELGIDRNFVANVYYTGGVQPDSVVFNLKARNIYSPVTWTLKVVSLGKEIFSYTQNDDEIDSRFQLDGYIDGAEGYVKSKENYYYNDLPAYVLRDDVLFPFKDVDQWQLMRIGKVVRSELVKMKMSLEDTDKLENQVVADIVGKKRPSLGYLISPKIGSSPRMWIPQLKQFIVYYIE